MKLFKLPEHMKPISNMTFALILVVILTLIFTIVMIVIFCFKGTEMSTLIERWFTVVGLELGGLLIKKIIDDGRNNHD